MTLSRSYIYILWLIIFLGTLLRVYGIWDLPLNLDERWHVYPAAMSNSLLDAILYHAKFDGHPPLTPIWTYLMLLVSDNNFWLRLPSLISGVLLIYVGYILGKKIGDTLPNTEVSSEKIPNEQSILCGLIFASLIAFSHLTILQSQVVRGYSVMLLCHAIAYYTGLKYNETNTHNNKFLYYFTAASVLGLLAIHSSIVFSASFGFIMFMKFLFVDKNYKKTLAWAFANSVIVGSFAASYALTTIYGEATGVMGPNGILNTQYNTIDDIIKKLFLNFNILSTSFIFSIVIYKPAHTLVFCIINALTIVGLFFYKKIKLHLLILLICSSLSTFMSFYFHNTIEPIRRLSYLLIPCFVFTSLAILLICHHFKFKKIHVASSVVLLLFLSAISIFTKTIRDEHYEFQPSNEKDFQLIGKNDILITDGVSVLELLYPEKRQVEKISPLVLKISDAKLSIYTYAFDFREIQAFITLHDYQQFLKSLSATGALENKDTVWIWRKMPPWGFDVQTQLYCGSPYYLNNIRNKEISRLGLVEWQTLSEKIKVESMRRTPDALVKRAQTSECQYVLYGLSVDFIKKEFLDKEFIDINTLVEKDIIENGTNNDPRKIKRMQMIFDAYRKGGSVL